MESYEEIRAVFSRVQSIDPENASKIIGYILLHYSEKDMIRFAYGPETLIISIINRAKTDLAISSNTSSAQQQQQPQLPSSPSIPISISRPNPLSIPRLPNNGAFLNNPSSPSSPSLWSHHQSPSNHPPHPNTLNNHSLSYAAVVNGTSNNNIGSSSFSSSSLDSPQMGANFIDDYQQQQQQQEQQNHLFQPNVDFFEDLAMSPSCRSDSMVYPFWENNNSTNAENKQPHFAHHHRRSASFNDMYYGTDDSTSGFGFKPCLYFARGFCKNGTSCKFVHNHNITSSGNNNNNNSNNINNGFSENCGENSSTTPPPMVGSPCKFDAFEQCQEEFFRSKLAHQQRLAAQLMSGGLNLPYNKLNFLQTEAQRSAAAALMMGEEFHKLNRARMARNEFSGMDSNPGSRQIYLTFPADSTFKEEDVSSYFNLYGPVQDVRIPYQQKRMFGFVTFVYPETVKLILAKGNPHFVCDSRVLVKPYKEKSKLPDKKQHQQQMERGEFSSCSSPSGHDGRDPYSEFQLGGRMLYSSTQEMLLRKKLEEQADLQQAIELQGRRLMNLQMLDLKNQQQHQHNPSMGGSPIPSPILHQQQALSNQAAPTPVASDGITQDCSEENNASATVGDSSEEQQQGVVVEGVNAGLSDSNGNVQSMEDKPKTEESELAESGLEHILPDNLFASPKKSASEQRSSSLFLSEIDNGVANASSSTTASSDSSMPASSPLSLAPHKSCFFEMPRLSTGQGALGM